MWMLRKRAFNGIQAVNAKENKVPGERVLGAPFLDLMVREGFSGRCSVNRGGKAVSPGGLGQGFVEQRDGRGRCWRRSESPR